MLNSVAIVFIFEFDTLLMGWFTGARHRRTYASLNFKGRPPPTQTMAEQDPERIAFYLRLVAGIDFFLMINFYFLAGLKVTWYPGHAPVDIYEVIRDSVYLRGASMGLVRRLEPNWIQGDQLLCIPPCIINSLMTP